MPFVAVVDADGDGSARQLVVGAGSNSNLGHSMTLLLSTSTEPLKLFVQLLAVAGLGGTNAMPARLGTQERAES